MKKRYLKPQTTIYTVGRLMLTSASEQRKDELKFDEQEVNTPTSEKIFDETPFD